MGCTIWNGAFLENQKRVDYQKLFNQGITVTPACKDESPRRPRLEVKSLILKRLGELQRHESHVHNPPLKSFYESQEAILEEVLSRAHGAEDDDTLLKIIDYCIRESRGYQRLSTDRGLKTFYGLKVRVLRGFRNLARRIHPRRWIRKRKK
jgi:hypothetical protein